MNGVFVAPGCDGFGAVFLGYVKRNQSIVVPTGTKYYPASTGIKSAVTLVAHGLNVKPAAMLFFVEWLNKQGSDVYLVRLSGHYNGSVPLKNVTAGLWQEEMRSGYDTAKKAAEAGSIPLYFFGFSLGALLGQTMISLTEAKPCFKRQVLIAPAIALRRRVYLIKLLFYLRKNFSLPSFTPASFRANAALPLNIYKILFAEEKKLYTEMGADLNIPTLVFLDPKDELISYGKIRRMISDFQLSNFRLHLLNQSLKNRKSTFHHEILNEETMGRENWLQVAQEIKAFLFSSK